jgi:UDP-N-acetylglucosamine pyrophosphorylase
MGNFAAFETKMLSAGMGEPVIRAFQRNYEALMRHETGLIPETTISPAAGIPSLEEISGDFNADPGLLSRVVLIKLNGGLGTGMGLQGPKSLLPVRNGVNFLDLIVRQISDLRQISRTAVRLLLMNSFSTSRETLRYLSRYREEGFDDASEVELMQNQVPKINASTMEPVECPSDPSLEWCPPGHGDLYTALVGSGWLERLLSEGVNCAFVSNSDNLGAVLEPAILQHFVDSGSPFLMEVTRRTAADRKGGHLAVRKSDGRLLLREVAQCPEMDQEAFQDIERHRYFNTNSLWIRLDLLKKELEKDGGVLPLPMIRNIKRVDSRDNGSTSVIQLETAMGAAIECFEGAMALEVPRNRFAPVKTTADLFSLRSDAYEVLGNGQVRLIPDRQGVPPVIMLPDEYKLVDRMESLGDPSLIGCRSLKIQGALHFEAGVVLQGDVSFENTGKSVQQVKAGIYKDQCVRL